jgi:hypothetical protein
MREVIEGMQSASEGMGRATGWMREIYEAMRGK